MKRSLGAVVAGMVLASCSLFHERAREAEPTSRPAGDEGMALYTVGRLTFEAPADWQARGDARHLLLVSPANDGRIDAQLARATFPDDAKCLADAEQALVKGSAALTNVRRHPSSLAGRKALFQEADQREWHGWAWALCDRGEQYRIFFTGRSPVDDAKLRAFRLLSSSATLAR
jgi:hypothetical protein